MPMLPPPMAYILVEEDATARADLATRRGGRGDQASVAGSYLGGGGRDDKLYNK